MYQGKHMKKTKKPAALLASLALVFAVAVAGTVAFLATHSGPVVNTFAPSSVPPTVVEDIENGVKKTVVIENSGNTDAYIRATVVVNWLDAEGNIYGGKVPEVGTDYEVTFPTDTGWKKGADGYYYYTAIVHAGEMTGYLLTNCQQTGTAPGENYKLSVEILAQTIQAKGESDGGKKPVLIVWGTENGGSVSAVDSTSGVLTIKQ